MNQINYLGVPITSKNETEIVINDAKGLTAVVEFIDGNKETFNNITEVHWLYPSIIKNDRRVALESDIHCTGYTYDIARIKSLVIDTSDKLHASI